MFLLQDVLRHFARLPYENISKIITFSASDDWESPKIRLPQRVLNDYLDCRLGGTCFSLTFFLQCILSHCGFFCYPVMADMRAGRNIHCCLVVTMGTVKYLVDPGYLLTRPMAISRQGSELLKNEFTGVEIRRAGVEGSFDIFTFTKSDVKWRYRFHDRPVAPAEFLSHWYASFSRNSMHGICLTRVLPDGLIFVNRNFMRETTFSGKTNFNIRRNYHSTIHEKFGIDKELLEQAEAALAVNLMREKALGLWRPKESVQPVTCRTGG